MPYLRLYVEILLYSGGSYHSPVIASTPNTGTYNWPILASQTPGTTYQIVIASTSDNTISDWSDNYFTILEPPTITVTSPNGGESWTAGTTHTITWTSMVISTKFSKIVNSYSCWI